MLLTSVIHERATESVDGPTPGGVLEGAMGAKKAAGSPEGFGDRVRRYRRALGWNQEELSHRSGIDRSYIGRIEAGKAQNPEPDTVRRLATALDTSMRAIAEPLGWYDDQPRDDWFEGLMSDGRFDDDAKAWIAAAVRLQIEKAERQTDTPLLSGVDRRHRRKAV